MADHSSRHHVPQGVQILSIIFYTGFAIPVSIVAIENFWPAGILLAGFFAYQWGRIPTLNGGPSMREVVDSVKPQPVDQTEKSSGNASFDAYREDLLKRLEQEQENFESFLTRLRDARDKTQFDQFMDERADAARQSTAGAT